MIAYEDRLTGGETTKIVELFLASGRYVQTNKAQSELRPGADS
jgi:hypothetical protein